jgi:hypothetical protein
MTHSTMSLKAIRAASSSGRAAPSDIIHSAFSIRGHAVSRRLIRSTTTSTFIAPSIAVPMISPSPMA